MKRSVWLLLGLLISIPVCADNVDARTLKWGRSLKGDYEFWHHNSLEYRGASFEVQTMGPNGSKAWYFHILDNKKQVWEFWNAVNWDAATQRHVYEITWSDRKNIFKKHSNGGVYVKVAGCELQDLKAYRDESYRKVQETARDDMSSYWAHKYEEADVLYAACVSIHTRIANGTYQ